MYMRRLPRIYSQIQDIAEAANVYAEAVQPRSGRKNHGE
jgi:hypothetical protein